MRITVANIIGIVARHYNLDRADFSSPQRSRYVSHPRQVAMYLARKYTKQSLPQIGSRFGDRDHTTVLHAGRRVAERLQSDPALADALDAIERRIARLEALKLHFTQREITPDQWVRINRVRAERRTARITSSIVGVPDRPADGPIRYAGFDKVIATGLRVYEETRAKMRAA